MAPRDRDAPVPSPDGTCTATRHDDQLLIRDAATGDLLATTSHRPGYEPVARWSPDGRLAHNVHSPEAQILHPATGTTTTLAGHMDEVSDLAWSPDSRRLATASVDNRVRIWDAATGRCLLLLHEHEQCVDEVVWRPQGDLIASRDLNNELLIWDPATGRIRTRIAPPTEVISLAWHPDGSHLIGMTEDGPLGWDPSGTVCRPTGIRVR